MPSEASDRERCIRIVKSQNRGGEVKSEASVGREYPVSGASLGGGNPVQTRRAWSFKSIIKLQVSNSPRLHKDGSLKF